MRIWHRDLIKVLPVKQLTLQWRECLMIKKLILEEKLKPHKLASRVLEFSSYDYFTYCTIVYSCMRSKGCRPRDKLLDDLYFFRKHDAFDPVRKNQNIDKLYQEWHNDR